MTKDINNAAHPARQLAIKIIEQVIEPRFATDGIEGEGYYELEDALTNLIAQHDQISA